MKRLENKIAFVTGGSRGIGAAIVKRLASEGANVAFTYINSADKATALATEIEQQGIKALAIKADSGDANEIKAAISQTADFFGSIDILVNNAGLFITGPVNDPDADIDAFNRQFAVNVAGVAAAVRAVTAVMGEGGRIISIGSTGGDRAPYPALGDYAATKAAVAAYTRAWSRDLGFKNITVNTIQPGLIDTDMNPADGAFSATMITATALGRYGKPADIAAAVAFLASEEANYITGTTLNIDGGFNA